MDKGMKKFLADLEYVYRADILEENTTTDVSQPTTVTEQIEEYSIEELQSLAVLLDSFRNKSIAKLKGSLKKLDGDHPLFCPISLYGVLGQSQTETAHTKTLAWLLDPTKDHGFDSVLIDAFLGSVFPEISNERIRRSSISEVVIVEAEHNFLVGSSYRRADIWIEGVYRKKGSREILSKWLVVIEAKIAADESEGQIADYDKYIDGVVDKYSIIRRCFLTPDGRVTFIPNENWTPVSFTRLAHIFATCLPQQKQKQVTIF